MFGTFFGMFGVISGMFVVRVVLLAMGHVVMKWIKLGIFTQDIFFHPRIKIAQSFFEGAFYF